MIYFFQYYIHINIIDMMVEIVYDESLKNNLNEEFE